MLTLGSGRIFALSGLDITGRLNVQPEIYASTFGWKAFPPTASPFPMYAHLFLMSDGRIFYSGGNMSGNAGVTPRILTLANQFSKAIAETPVPGLVAANAGDQAASVLLPPAQDQRVMIMGRRDGHVRGRQYGREPCRDCESRVAVTCLHRRAVAQLRPHAPERGPFA